MPRVRLDTPSSRRVDFKQIVREICWELDANGCEDIDIFVIDGIIPEKMRNLQDDVDGFGIGDDVSNANPVDFTLDIVEVEGTPTTKRGKLSGKKQVYRTDDGDHHVCLAHHKGSIDGEELLDSLIRDDELVRNVSLDAAIEQAMADAERTDFAP